MDTHRTFSRKEKRCRHAFNRLSAALSNKEAEGDSKESITHAKCLDAFDRFKIWADSHVFKDEAVQLRNAPRLTDQIFKLLDDLEEALADVCRIMIGEKPSRVNLDIIEDINVVLDNEPDSDMDHDENYTQPKFEIEEGFLFVSDLITHLFRLTVLIKNIPPREDTYVRAAVTVTGDVLGDNDELNSSHVGRMFSKLERGENEWLKVRMGRANELRRQNIRHCRERYHLKQSRKARKTALKVYLSNADDGPTPKFQPMDIPTAPESHTSALSAINFNKHGFDCPYCYERRHDSSERQWRQHALEDIRPYVCTFEGCGLKLFRSQAAWWEHEIQTHRREWGCSLCSSELGDLRFQSRDELEDHVQAKHRGQIPDVILPAFIQACHRLRIQFSTRECPFCDCWEVSPGVIGPDTPSRITAVTAQQFQDHVGKHMLELAYATFPETPQLSWFEPGSAPNTKLQSGHDTIRAEHDFPNAAERRGGKKADPPQVPKKLDINRRDEDGRTPLALAALHGHVGLVTDFLTLPDILPEAPDNSGRTPISLAAERGHHMTVYYLAQKASVAACDRFGRSVLSWACEGQCVDTIAHLISRGADVSAQDHRGRTPISYAAENPRLEILERLLWFGPNPLHPDASGQLPLSHASRVGNYCNTLLLFGACWDIDVRPRNTEILNPMEWAKENRCEDALENIVGAQLAEPDRWDKIRRVWENFERRRPTGAASNTSLGKRRYDAL